VHQMDTNGLHNLYSSPNVVRVVKPREGGGEVCVAYVAGAER
jgi:hypothetical protein